MNAGMKLQKLLNIYISEGTETFIYVHVYLSLTVLFLAATLLFECQVPTVKDLVCYCWPGP